MRDFLSKAIFFRLSIALIIGILLSEFLEIPQFFYLLLAVLGIGLMLIFVLKKNIKFRYRFDWLFGLGFLLIVVCMGGLLTIQDAENQKFNHNGEKGVYQISLTDFPIEKARSVLIYADLKSFSDSAKTENCKGQIVLYLQKDSNTLNLQSGDKLLISTILSLPENKNNPDEFDYGTYLSRRGIVAAGYAAIGDWQKIGAENGFSIMRTAQKCRRYLLDIYRNMNISGDEFGVVAALTLGYTDALSPELRDSFSATGASHILSVSGMHVAVIFMVINYLLASLDKNIRTKQAKALAIIFFLWFYAFITGLCPSVCRSVLMFSLIMLGEMTTSKPYTYNTIFCSAFILLIINPMWLFDVGFQLSYAAVLSIVFFQPPIRNLLKFKSKPMIWFWDLTSVSIAAQLGTMPIAQYYFHQFPNYFLFANYTAIPLSSIIIYSAMLLFVVYKIPIINVLASFTLEWSTKAMNFCVRFIENLSNALSFGWLNLWQVCFFYGVIFSIGVLTYRVKVKLLLCFAVFSILFIFTILIHNIDNEHFNQLTIFNENKNFTLNIVNNNQNLVYSSYFENSEKIASAFWVHHACKNADFQAIDATDFAQIVQFDNKNFAILTNKKIYSKQPETPLEVDYLIVNKNIFPSKDIFEKYFRAKNLITAGDVYENNNKKFAVLAEENGINFYSIRKKGAFILQK